MNPPGDTKAALRGLGVWIWERAKCERGDPARIAAQARAAGVRWVAVKCGQEHSNGQVDRKLVEGLRAGGVECAVWWYSRPQSFDLQIAMLLELVDRAGVRHFIQDAEVEWDVGGLGAVASTFALRLRRTLGRDAYLADAPWARPLAHKAPFPYAEFGQVMDARMPQAYWELAEERGEPFAHFVAQSDLEWAATAPGQDICPVGSCVNYTGVLHCPPSELGLFLDRYASRPARSLWSWQHLDAAEWALLEDRERGREAALAVADVTDGGQDRPVHPPIDVKAT